MRRTARSRCLVAAAALGSLAVLSACGSASASKPTPTARTSSSGTSSDSSAVTGTPIITAGFSTVAPDGWNSNPELCGNKASLQTCLYNSGPSGQGGALAIIQVFTMDSAVADADLASSLKALVTRNGAQDMQSGTETVAGDDAPAVTYNTNPSDAAASQNEDLMVNHGGKTYEISLLVRAGADYQTYSSDFSDILSAWKWR